MGKCPTIPATWLAHYFGPNYQTEPYAAVTADADGDGVNNLQEYQRGTDPNKIAFHTSFANDHVNTDSVSGSIVVDRGIPVQMAVLVNPGAFATTNWTAYSPTFIAALPTTDGKYQVWVGLRGFAADSQQTWNVSFVTRDTVPPTIYTTSPAPGTTTTSCPLLQVQGYSPEALASVSYDLSNAGGLVANQPVFVLDQHYDTNTWQFTTNYFQAFDLQLANGLNTITLHATDLAGNASVATLTLTLASDTVAPIITLGWPQNGQKLCGDSFTVDGWLDDPSATVQVSIMDNSGVASTYGGLVERDGRFWVENLPLAAGANTLALTATDAWGNSVTTNLTLYKSDLTLGLTPIDPSQLFQPTISLGGTVSDLTCTIWVNGVPASNNGDGTWSAASVPINKGGTASFAMAAYPAGHDLEANAASLMKPSVDLPDRLYVDLDRLSGKSTYDTTFVTYDWDGTPVYSDVLHMQTQYDRFWQDDDGGLGFGSSEYTDTSSNGSSSAQASKSFSWPACFWPNFLPGDLDYEGDRVDYLWTGFLIHDTAAAPSIALEHCDVSDPLDQNGSGFDWLTGLPWVQTGQETYTRHAQTKMKLFTGGKAIPGRQSLFAIRGGATELLNKRATPPYTASHDGIVDYIYACQPIPNQSVNIGGDKLGADGLLYKVFPDRATVDVTPRVVPDKQFYWFNITEQRYKLHIVVDDGTRQTPLAEDRVAPMAKYCVGQYLAFSPMWRPGVPPGIANQAIQWDFGGNYVNDSWQLCTNNPEFPVPIYYGSVNYSNNPAMLTNENTHAWWVSGGFESPDEYTASLTEKLSFSNGQAATLSRKGLFDMSRPKILGFTPSTSTCVVLDANDPSKIYLGVGGKEEWEGGNMQWRLNFKVPGAEVFLGNVAYTQLVQGDFDYNVSYLGGTIWLSESTDGEYWLDNREEYLTKPIINSSRTLQWFDFMDGPSLSARFLSWVDEMDQFKTYMRYKPCTTGAIYITLGRVDWGWHGRAEGTPWSLTVSNIFGPVLDASDQAFPRWEETYYNAGSGH